MPQGLEIYDDDGKVVLDTTTYTAKVLGTLIIKPNTQGAITHKGFAKGTPFCVCNALDFFSQFAPKVQFNGNQMNYSYHTSHDKAPNVMLIYGVQ